MSEMGFSLVILVLRAVSWPAQLPSCSVAPFSSQCHQCHSTCAQCTGPDPNQCTDCQGELQLDSWSSTCVSCCKQGTSQSYPCCDCSGSQSLCTTHARHRGTVFSPAMLVAVFLVAGFLGGGIIACFVSSTGRGAGQLGVGVAVVDQTAKYSRVPDNNMNGHGEGSEDWSDSEEEFLIVNEKT